MNLVEFADRVGTFDVVVGLIFGIAAWTAVNAGGLYLVTRYLNSRATKPNERLAYSTAQAGIRLLASVVGIIVGFLAVSWSAS